MRHDPVPSPLTALERQHNAAIDRAHMFDRLYHGKPTPSDLFRLLDEIVDGGKIWNELAATDEEIQAFSDALVPLTNVYGQQYHSLRAALGGE